MQADDRQATLTREIKMSQTEFGFNATIKATSTNAVLTIVFLNKSQNGMGDATPTVWVCQTMEHYQRSLKVLKSMPHIQVLDSGLAHFVRD
jgi:hypothetical protein